MRASAVILLILLTGLSVANAATETQISGAVTGPASYRYSTRVASSGNGYLVVWGEGRDANYGFSVVDTQLRITIRALKADGTPVRPFATVIGEGESPSIVWNGHEYLVVWGITAPTTGALPTPSVVGVRVREDGTVIDPDPVTLVAEVNPYSYLTSITWSGSRYLLTWTRGVTLLDTDLHATQIFLSQGVPLYSASSGGGFLVLPATFSGLSTQVLSIVAVSAAGNLSEPIPLDGPHAAITGVDGGYVLLWDDRTNLRSARLRLDGTMVSTSTVFLGQALFQRVAARDGRIVAAWQTNDSTICTTRIDTASQPRCSNAGQHDPAIGTASRSALLAWSDRAAEGDAVRVAVSSSGDAPQAGSTVGTTISDLQPPAPAAVRRADDSVIAAWTEYNATRKQSEVHIGGISSRNGRFADRVIFATPLDQGAPVISAGAGRTAFLWTEGTEPKIRMTIIDDASGTLIATLLLSAGVAPSAAFNGKEWLVTWQSDDVIRFAILNSDGFVLSSGAAPATTAPPSQSTPAAAWSGKTFVLAWIETNRVQISTINAAGAPSAPVTLDSRDIFPGTLSIAGNGSRVLVAWGRTGNILRQAVFDADGRQVGRFIDFAWPEALTRTTTHAMPIGFATLAGAHVALTSADAVGLDTIDVPPAATAGDFVVDPANRFTFIYPRLIGRGSSANFAQTMGLPRRRPQNR